MRVVCGSKPSNGKRITRRTSIKYIIIYKYKEIIIYKLIKYIIILSLLLYICEAYCNTNNLKNVLSNNIIKLQVQSKCKLKITSGYRSRKDNARVGGAKNSYHLKDLARDLVIVGKCGHDYRSLGKIAKNLFPGVITYYNHLHVDMRKKPFHKHKVGKKYVDLL